MLTGWTMLADECQDCYVPLMGKKGKENVCVVCGDGWKKYLPKDVKWVEE